MKQEIIPMETANPKTVASETLTELEDWQQSFGYVDPFSKRMQRIKQSLERINNLMNDYSDLKKS